MQKQTNNPVKHQEPPGQERMKILVYGGGVIGSVYAARLQEAGYNVTLLARGQRAASLRTNGIRLEDARTEQRTTIPVPIIDHLAPADAYDLVLVTVRMDQVASVLPALAANHQIHTVLFLLNNPAGMPRLQVLEPQRVVLCFPGMGGSRQGEVVHYMLIRQQPTTLGEVDGRITPRVQQLASVLRKAGSHVALSHDMQAWLKTHAVFVSCVSAALAMVGGDSIRLAHTRTSVVMMVKAIREGFRALQALGMMEMPFNLKVLFLWMPEWFAVRYWQYAFQTPVGTLAIAPHANAARDEMRHVATDMAAMLHASSVATPTLDHLLTFLDVPIALVQ
jgi:2-dehydropantoate 2-reductase